MIKQNLHTHSCYDDGKDTIDEMVLTAIEKGFTKLGFSGHGQNLPMDHISMPDEKEKKYIQDVLEAKEKYKDQIDIFLGIEQDVQGKRFDKNVFDYVIGSVHFLPGKNKYVAIDLSKEVTKELIKEAYNDDWIAYTKAYYGDVKRVASFEEVDIIGHLDLITKFNEDEEFCAFDDPKYLDVAEETIDYIISLDKIFEVNTGAIARGLRKTPYPHKTLLKYIAQKQGKICLNSDCHNRQYLDYYFNEALELIEEVGFKHLYVLTKDGFVPMSIK